MTGCGQLGIRLSAGLCLTCGHVGCGDPSPHRHARNIFMPPRTPDHPVLRAWRELALVLRSPGGGL
ncbi:MAG: UBP-type zinc finger domain-containing protein [Candidatus Sulfotelmatobacter sp.]